MLNWLKRKQDPPKPSASGAAGEPIIAALLLDIATFDMAAAHRAIIAGPMMNVVPREAAITRQFFNFKLNDEMMFIAPMPAPYPWSDLEGPCQTSWMWPKDRPANTLKDHKTHVLLTAIQGQQDPVSRRALLTHVVARLAQLPGVMGVFWPEGTLAHYPPIFVKMAALAAPKRPALFLWIDYRIFKEADGSLTCFTTGLKPLGLMEMEISRMQMAPGALREWAMNITQYMLDRGGPVPHGDTIGSTDQQRLRVTHGPSRFGGRGQVMRFGAPA